MRRDDALSQARYQIPDEPRPGGLVRYAVDPMWPLLATMLAGGAAGFAWFALNAHALGSPRRAREWAFVIGGLCAGAVALLAVAMAEQRGLLDASAVPYALLSVPALKLSLAYALYLSQSTSAELLEHFGQPLKNGLPALIIGVVIAHGMLSGLQNPLLAVVLR